MNKKELKELLFEYDVTRNYLYEQVKKYCQDTSKDLDDRWKIFIDSDMGDHIGSIQRFKSIDMDLYFDNWYKYEVISIDSIIEWFTDYSWEDIENENPDKSEDEILNIIDSKLAPFKEEVLRAFIKSFTFDW